MWRKCLERATPTRSNIAFDTAAASIAGRIGRAIAVRNHGGEIVRWIGTCTDIHETKRVAEQNEIFSRELSHRIKNIFAVIGGLVSLSSRQQPGHESFRRQVCSSA